MIYLCYFDQFGSGGKVKLKKLGVPQHVMVERTHGLIRFRPYNVGEDWVKRH